MSKLRAAHDIISQQAATIAIQHTAIQSAHDTKTTAEAALLRAVDETEEAHMQWLECSQKLDIVEMQRQMTYLILGGRRTIACPGCTRSSVMISELIDEDI
jgi:hypothetical protein